MNLNMIDLKNHFKKTLDDFLRFQGRSSEEESFNRLHHVGIKRYH